MHTQTVLFPLEHPQTAQHQRKCWRKSFWKCLVLTKWKERRKQTILSPNTLAHFVSACEGKNQKTCQCLIQRKISPTHTTWACSNAVVLADVDNLNGIISWIFLWRHKKDFLHYICTTIKSVMWFHAFVAKMQEEQFATKQSLWIRMLFCRYI